MLSIQDIKPSDCFKFIMRNDSRSLKEKNPADGGINNNEEIARKNIAPLPEIGSDAIMETYFRRIVVLKKSLKNFCESFPKGGNLHEHSGFHHEDRLNECIDRGLYWNPQVCLMSECLGEGGFAAKELNMPIRDKERVCFFRTITQPKIKEFQNDPKLAMKHFHATFVITEQLSVPFWKCWAHDYIAAWREGLHHQLLMFDPPLLTELPSLTLPPDLDKLPEEEIDKVLEAFYQNIQDSLNYEVQLLKKILEEEEVKANEKVVEILGKEKLGGDYFDGIFGTGGPVNISLQVEIGKIYALNCQDSDEGKLLARFAYDVVKAMELERCCDFVVSINCVGPEHLARRVEPQEGVILDFFFKKYQGNIAYHAGELCPPLCSAAEMSKIAAVVTQKIHAKRIGHGVCLTKDAVKATIEVCPTATKRLLGKHHPFMDFIKAGVPIVVCTDNRYVFDKTPADEFYAILKNWPGVTYKEVKTLARNSLHYSDLSGDSILENNAEGFTVREGFVDFIEMDQVELDAAFRDLPAKQKIQIRHERAIKAFENDSIPKFLSDV